MKAKADELTFEQAMEKLDGVVKRLESGEGALEEMIAQYEEGMGLAKRCSDMLDAYEARVTKLAELEEAEACRS